jgi:hypothetical protein
MEHFKNLVIEAEAQRNRITVLFEKAYYSKQDTSRLQRIFNRATERIIRRKFHVYLLEYAHNLPMVSDNA